jgi:hypothetical protein
MRRLLLLLIAPTLCAAGAVRADDLLPADRPIHAAIDHYIGAGLRADGIEPAPRADDATLIRRLTLDLCGRIPTAAEADTYVRSSDPEKRVKLVERLMNSPAFARHQAREFDAMLMEGTRGSLAEYLTVALKENRTWDRIFRDVMLPDQKDPLGKKAGEFLRQRVRDVDQMTNAVSVIFFGVNVTCAKCHDHPLVSDWKQAHFFGMKSFLNRTFDNGGFLAERGYGEVKFQTTKGVTRTARLMFLTGKVVETPTLRSVSRDEEKKAKARFEQFRKRKEPPPAPEFSARAALVKLALQPEQRGFFSRSIVNRVWGRFLGRGLVHPLDQMHSANPASHPELLDWLARDMVGHGYDLRRLIRGVVLSDTYARSSRWEGDDRPAARTFGVAQVRPLTPMQLAVSLRLATTDPGQFPAGQKPDEFARRIEQLENSARGFSNEIARPTYDDFLISVDEALLFSNAERIRQEFLADGKDRLLGQLAKVKNHREGIDLLYRNVLSRPPEAEEVRLLDEYLAKRKDRPVEGYRQVLWTLLTTSEFRFNH